MKKRVSIILIIAFTFGVMFTGFAFKSTSKAASAKTPLKVVLLLNGNLGDKSFFDSANQGMKLIKDQLGATTKTIEMTYDQTKWEPTLLDISEQDWDIIICGTWQMTDYLQKIAPDHPEKKYIIFDTEVDYKKADFKNVYSIEYKQNEASFLAGALATKVTTSKMPLANNKKIIGFLGGMDIPVINDFLVGYIEGAKYIDKNVKVAISYIGSFDNSAKGKEMALAQYNLGADIGFNVAGQAGLGQLDAAKDKKKYAIGVDSDQALIFKSKDPAKANLITTSVLKRVDNSLLRAVKMHIAGTLKYGTAEFLGFKENAVGLAKNEYYNKLISAKMRAEIEDLTKKITAGKIKVSTALGMDNKKLNTIRNSVKP